MSVPKPNERVPSWRRCFSKKMGNKLTIEELDKAVPEKVYETITEKRNNFVMKVSSMCIFTNLLFQAAEIDNYISSENYFSIIYAWTFSIVCVSLASVYWFGKKKSMVYPLVLILTLR